jgi:hypothetical protein
MREAVVHSMKLSGMLPTRQPDETAHYPPGWSGDEMSKSRETAKLLKSIVDAGEAKWETLLGEVYLNDLSKAYDQMWEFEGIVGEMHNRLTENYFDHVVGSGYSEYYEALVYGGLEELKEAVQTAQDGVTAMVDEGMADEGYEDAVQEQMEDSIHPGLEEAMEDFKREYGTPRLDSEYAY